MVTECGGVTVAEDKICSIGLRVGEQAERKLMVRARRMAIMFPGVEYLINCHLG